MGLALVGPALANWTSYKQEIKASPCPKEFFPGIVMHSRDHQRSPDQPEREPASARRYAQNNKCVQRATVPRQGSCASVQVHTHAQVPWSWSDDDHEI